MIKTLLAFTFALLLPACARAEVRLPNVLSDHAVLQRDRPIHLWGSATPGARLIIAFDRQTVPAVANALGHWSLYLAPEQAGGPYALTIRGDGPEKKLVDLLVGDVWIASGQSNMEMPLAGFPPGAFVKDADKEIAAATNPRLRLLVVEHKTSDFPLRDLAGHWTECTPATAKYFSAVAYFFGREIAAREHVPIGLVDSTWGGTPADSWVSLDTLGNDPALLPAFASRAVFANKQTDLDAQIAAEKAEDEEAKSAGKPAPQHDWHPYETSWLPAALYNGMIAPLAPLSIKGFLWYQGETNSSHDRAPYYGRLFRALIADWRAHFAQGMLPFLYVQISSYQSPGEDWATVRDQQRRVLNVASTAMAVSLDLGQADNVHPANKQEVGARLALAARSLVYGETVQSHGPVYREATPELTKDGSTVMRVWFDSGSQLSFHGKPAGGFELAAADHRFVPAQARIVDDQVLVSAASIAHPVYVRYGWASVVENVLYNGAGLPASTFSSEENPVH